MARTTSPRPNFSLISILPPRFVNVVRAVQGSCHAHMFACTHPCAQTVSSVVQLSTIACCDARSICSSMALLSQDAVSTAFFKDHAAGVQQVSAVPRVWAGKYASVGYQGPGTSLSLIHGWMHSRALLLCAIACVRSSVSMRLFLRRRTRSAPRPSSGRSITWPRSGCPRPRKFYGKRFA